jgi:polyhydroxyalkanoate synthesis regulator phasin/type IV secretory pathway VirB10-like protein
MADFSKLNFLSRLDARARLLVLLMGLAGIVALVYLGVAYFGGGTSLGASQVANVPSGMQSVPGGTGASAEYQRAVISANTQAAEAAKMTGRSSVPTQINTGNVGFGMDACVICSDKDANIKSLLDQWIAKGKLSPDVAAQLAGLAAKNVSTEEFSGVLAQLLKEGKITPEQARQLLDQYKKQHMNNQLKDSEGLMDKLIKSGQLSLDGANQLLDAQKQGVSVADYAKLLQKMVKDGKLSPQAAQQLLQQYSAQRMQEGLRKHEALINQMAQDGAITPDVAKKLIELSEKNLPVDDYAKALNDLVASGQLTPAAAAKLLESYKQMKAISGSLGTIDGLLQQAENDAYKEISDLLAAGKITNDVATQLRSMLQNKVPLNDFKAAVSQMVQENKLTPEIAQLKVNDYVKVSQLREARQTLSDLQANNATPAEYAEALKKLVAAGILTPEQAALLLDEYQAMTAPSATPIEGESAFAELAQKIAAAKASQPATVNPEEFAAVQTKITQESDEDRKARIAAIMAAMNEQATQLISSWQPPTMAHKEGTPEVLGKGTVTTTTTTSTLAGGPASLTALAGGAAPLLKGGSILFAVLDTAINSDYPDTPIMATIVTGKFKGATLLGKIQTAKSATGQLDRVSLNFTLMNRDDWPKSKAVTAYAIDPDTARTVLASSVDYHYLQRYGAMIATSFLQGYSTAITNQGNSTTGIFGTSTTHPELSPGNKLMVGLGQVGQTLGAATQNYINRAPTVRVDSGVSLGILFMNDVS